MLFLSSPAKTLNFSTNWESDITTSPIFSEKSEVIANVLKGYSLAELAEKLKISEKLSEINYKRYKSWNKISASSRSSYSS